MQAFLSSELTFTDSAVSGTSAGDAHRDGYPKAMDAWQKGLFEVLLVDEFSRLSRDAVEQAKLVRRLDTNHRIRLVTADGTDTQTDGWQLLLGIKGVIAQDESRKLRHRVMRGMQGQLERGYMIADAAFGYKRQRCFDDKENHIGTLWRVDEDDANIVREIYARCAKGESRHQVARWLNTSGVPIRRKPRTERGGHWTAARVRSVLINPIYRGVFVWHGSETYAYAMKARCAPVEKHEYAHDELRLVEDDIWYRCNTKITHRSGYGGVKYPLSGLINCGSCGAILSVQSVNHKGRALFCAACTNAKQFGVDADRQTNTVSVDGVKDMLVTALRFFVAKPLIEAFHQKLTSVLTGDKRVELQDTAKRLKELTAAQTRLSHMLANVSEDDPILTERYEETRTKALAAKSRLDELEAGMEAVNQDAVQTQLNVDPMTYLENLFNTDIPPHELQALLIRLFPKIVFKDKLGHRTSIFDVHFAPGVAIALASDTETIIKDESHAQFSVRYYEKTLKEPAHWTTVVTSPVASQTASPS